MFVPVIKAVSSVNWAADCTGQEIGKSLERVLERKKNVHILWPPLVKSVVTFAVPRADLVQDRYCTLTMVGRFAHERRAKGP